jgi:hypothetical protein
MTTQEENALRIHIEKLENQNQQMRKLSTRQGFYDEYFKALQTAKTNREAFNNINEKYYSLFNQYRYSDWDSFKKMVNYYNNKK